MREGVDRDIGAQLGRLAGPDPFRRLWRQVPAHWRRNGVSLAVLLIAFDLSVLADASYVGRIYGVAFLLIVPGAALLAPTPLQPRETSIRIAWSVGLSILLLMLLGLLESLVLPHLGIARPLTRWPIVIGVDLITMAALAGQVRRRDPLDYLLRGYVPSRRDVAIIAGLVLLPLGAMAGAERLNSGASGALAILVLVLVGLVLLGLFVYAGRLPRWVLGASLYSATASVLLMSSMRSNFPYGYDIQTEFQVFTATLHNGVWNVPLHGNAYASMLSITILPAALSATTHLSGVYLFKTMYPLVFSLFPAIVLVVSARWLPLRAALVGAVVVIVQGLFAADINGLARQQIGLTYFALFVVTAFDDHLPRRTRQVAVAVTGIAMAITHYSTAYFTVTVLLFGYVVYGVIRLAGRRKTRPHAVFTLPVLVLTIGVVLVWNVSITRSAQNVGNLVSSINSDGLQLLSGSPGSSLLQRVINADVGPSVTTAQFGTDAASYYRAHDPWIHPYPVSLTKHYPIKDAPASSPASTISPTYDNVVTKATTWLNELLLLVTGIGGLALLWRERRGQHPERAELAAVSLGCLFLLGLLRFSATISSLYNAPRGQVQGSPVLSVGLALVCAWLFTRRRGIGAAAVALASLSIALLLFADSGLGSLALAGEGVDTLTNYGDAYQMFFYSNADIASAQWVTRHDHNGDALYTDIYGGLQIYQGAEIRGIVNTVLPSVLEPGTYVYATTANVVDKTARSQVGSEGTQYRFPAAFLSRVKNVVYSTATTKVYR